MVLKPTTMNRLQNNNNINTQHYNILRLNVLQTVFQTVFWP